MASAATDAKALRFFRGLDPRRVPRYSYGHAASLIHVPESALRSWLAGPDPIFTPSDPKLLSFLDMLSAFMLSAFRARDVAPRDLREMIVYYQQQFGPVDYPLLQEDFLVRPGNVVLERSRQLINLTKNGQLEMHAVFGDSMERIRKEMAPVFGRYMSQIGRDGETGSPVQFYPPGPSGPPDRQRTIVIDPRYAGGEPVIATKNIPAGIIADRHRAGEGIASLAKDYGIKKREVEEAIRYFQAA